MHAVSIAMSIIDLAEQQIRASQPCTVQELELEIGKLAGIELQTLNFALTGAVKGTAFEEAKITQHIIEGQGRCSGCETEFVMDSLLTPCPKWGSYFIHILQGREMRLKSISIN